MIEQYVIASIFLIILSILDVKTFNLKHGFIPAALTTLFLIVVFIMAGVSGIITGLFASLIAMLFIDLDIFHGVADLKIFIACGITLPSIMMVGVFGLTTLIAGVGYKFLAKKTKLKEIPFIPILLVGYVSTLAIILL